MLAVGYSTGSDWAVWFCERCGARYITGYSHVCPHIKEPDGVFQRESLRGTRAIGFTPEARRIMGTTGGLG